MRIVIHATEIIDGKAYITENLTVDAKDCSTPEGAETVMLKVLTLADDTFKQIRARQHGKSSYGT
jgi:hypothetical protein